MEDFFINHNSKILIITAASKNLKNRYKITNLIKIKYCNTHGYDYLFEEIKNTTIKDSYKYRINLLKNQIQTKKYDYVMWLDDDAWFNNFNIKIEDIISEHLNDKSLIIGYDYSYEYDTKRWYDCYINSGVLLFKSCENSIKILDRWSESMCDCVAQQLLEKWSNLNDQPHLCLLLIFDEFVKSQSVIVKPEVLNWFPTDRQVNGILSLNTAESRKDKFILHGAGIKTNNKRLKESEEAILETCENNNIPINYVNLSSTNESNIDKHYKQMNAYILNVLNKNYPYK